jgi:integrase
MKNESWTKIKKQIGLYRYDPSGQYFARIRRAGKLHRRSLETSDFELAKRKLRDFIGDIERTDHTKGNMSFAAVLDAYEATLTGSESSLWDKRHVIAKLKQTLFGAATLPLRKIKPSAVEAWLAKHYGSKSASYYNNALSIVRAALDMAVRDRIITENPADALKYRKRKRPIRDTPTFEQFQQIVASVRAQKFNGHDAEASGDFLEFVGLAGLGQAEAAAIKRSDVDLDAGRMIVYRHKTDAGFSIPIYPQARALVEKLCEGKAQGERLFPINQAHKALVAACERLGFPRFTQRSLRRMFITRAIELGVDVKVIAEWQGHRDGGKLILDTYSHVRPQHSWRMAQLMTTEQPANVIELQTATARPRRSFQ